MIPASSNNSTGAGCRLTASARKLLQHPWVSGAPYAAVKHRFTGSRRLSSAQVMVLMVMLVVVSSGVASRRAVVVSIRVDSQETHVRLHEAYEIAFAGSGLRRLGRCIFSGCWCWASRQWCWWWNRPPPPSGRRAGDFYEFLSIFITLFLSQRNMSVSVEMSYCVSRFPSILFHYA